MARIRIDADRTVGQVDRKVFSGFVEHLGRCIYGGLYEQGSPLSDEHGFGVTSLRLSRSWTRRCCDGRVGTS